MKGLIKHRLINNKISPSEIQGRQPAKRWLVRMKPHTHPSRLLSGLNLSRLLSGLNLILNLAFIAVLTILIWGCGSPETKESPFHLPEGFTIESVVAPELISYPMFASFDDRGRLFVFESTEPNDMETEDMLTDPSYQIRLLTDTDLDGHFDKSVVYADEIPFPMGGTFYKGSLYVAASPDLLKLTDTNEDGMADKKEVVLTGWILNVNGAILSGPFLGPDGRFYLADARRGFDITSKEGVRFQGKGARIWRCLPDGSELEWVSGGGFDNSIEIDFMPCGDPIGTMTYFRDPANGQRDALMHWVYGGVYPKPQAVIEEDQLKLTGDLMPVLTRMPRVAPAGIVRFRGERWGKEYDGAWFTALFNTGEILRHSIRPEGGSYVSEDKVFLSSDLDDFHPTDVLQDGNGDLLVVVTGGWFIKGCPLSRVAKPEVPGGIYRIKMEGTTEYEDPWGTALDFQKMTMAELTDQLDDERPMVHRNALKALLEYGRDAIGYLGKQLNSEISAIRLEALFALHRLHLEEGDSLVRNALNDDLEAMRIAAARLTGLRGDRQAVPGLIDLVKSDPSIRVRRQAATALGQIGDADAVPDLLIASAGMEDRFLLHAIRYALITMNSPDKVLSGLSHPDPSVRISALIVLDQMDESPLTREHIRPFITSSDEELQEAGIWVLSHHTEWADIVTGYIKGQLAMADLTKERQDEISDLLITFCGNPEVQSFIQQTLSQSAAKRKLSIALLDVMSRCSGSVPAGWVAGLDQQLKSSFESVRSAALEVIESHQISGLEASLENMLANATGNPEVYLKVLHARLTSQPGLSDEEFNQVLVFLDNAYSVPVRRSAIRVLDRADLPEEQLMSLARFELKVSDAITLPGLIHLFEGDSTAKIGEELVQSLLQKTEYLNTFSENDILKALAGYPPMVRETAKPLLDEWHRQSSDRLNRLIQLETGLVDGDVGRGRDLFFGKAVCSTCHAIGEEGHDFGPDLTTIGVIRSRHDLLEAIVFPGVSFAREHETYVVVTADGSSFTGLLKDGLADGIVAITTAPGQEVRIQESEVVSIEPGEVSMMPAGLDKSLSNQELSDLIAFLQALPYTVDRLIELSE